MNKNTAFQRAILISSYFECPVTLFSRSLVSQPYKRHWTWRCCSTPEIEHDLLWHGWRKETTFNNHLRPTAMLDPKPAPRLIDNWDEMKHASVAAVAATDVSRLIAGVMFENTAAGDALRHLAMGPRIDWNTSDLQAVFKLAAADQRTIEEYINDGAPDFDPLTATE